MLSQGHLYYISDQYFLDFPDEMLMQNKESVGSQAHDRPCFYAFADKATNLFWLIPLSSQVEKYKTIYNKKIQKYGKCDTIAFGYVLGHEKAFLIQNMCPVTEKYIKNEYIDKRAAVPVRIDKRTETDIISKARKILALQRTGRRFIFPDVIKIEKTLLSESD